MPLEAVAFTGAAVATKGPTVLAKGSTIGSPRKQNVCVSGSRRPRPPPGNPVGRDLDTRLKGSARREREAAASRVPPPDLLARAAVAM